MHGGRLKRGPLMSADPDEIARRAQLIRDRVLAGMKPEADDAVLCIMVRANVPLTRENYLSVAFMGDPPSSFEEIDLPPCLFDD
jgi:hypothetical protein